MQVIKPGLYPGLYSLTSRSTHTVIVYRLSIELLTIY